MAMQESNNIGLLYAELGAKKANGSFEHMLLMGILAGFIIGMGSAVSNTATHAMENAGLAKTVAGLLFPFGLAIIMIFGAELFTGNCMIPLSVAAGRTSVGAMLKNWCLVYGANFIGASLLALACAYSGQFALSGGKLALYTIKVASAKCSMPFASAFIMGILCNLLVCLGVLCGLPSKETSGKVIGTYMPVAFFIVCGFEHSIANMFYIPAGIFALGIEEYAVKAAEAGLHTQALTWTNFVVKNLVPVTLGNIAAGCMLAFLLWRCKLKPLQSSIAS